MSVPDEVREELKSRLWLQAREIGWVHLPAPAKSRQYDNWAKDPQIGGILERYIDSRSIRAYLKDTLLKRYSAHLKSAPDRPLRVLGIPETEQPAATYTKPHGRRLADGRVVVWGKASEWKALLMALHERAYEEAAFSPFGAVFFEATGRFGEHHTRIMVEDAARRLGVAMVIWLEM